MLDIAQHHGAHMQSMCHDTAEKFLGQQRYIDANENSIEAAVHY